MQPIAKHPGVVIVILSVINLLSTASIFVLMNLASVDEMPGWTVLLALVLFFIFLSGTLYVVIYSYNVAFKEGTFSLFIVIACYLSLTVNFAAPYFLLQAITEHEMKIDDVWQEVRGRAWRNEDRRLALIRPEDNLWVDAGTSKNSNERIFLKIRSRGALAELIADSFHFSASTITTLGYGDIRPNVWYTKFLADVECLMGVSIVVIAIGMYISSRTPLGEKKIPSESNG